MARYVDDIMSDIGLDEWVAAQGGMVCSVGGVVVVVVGGGGGGGGGDREAKERVESRWSWGEEGWGGRTVFLIK